MKFGEFRELCRGKTYLLIKTDKAGQTKLVLLSLDYTALAEEKLKSVEDAEVKWVRPSVTHWPWGDVATMEVQLNV